MPRPVTTPLRAWLLSTTLHLIVLVAAGRVWISGSVFPVEQSVAAIWEADEVPRVDLETHAIPEHFSLASAGAETIRTELVSPSELTLPVVGDPPPLDVRFPQPSAKPTGTRAGTGTAAGGGAGDAGGVEMPTGDGFFGGRLKGESFVFVLDASKSMNHPHASPAKTRFKRLKLELLSCVAKLHPTQEFFIIFFNTEPHPMPSQQLQPAVPQMQQRFLGWASKMRANGDTDPRDALRIALSLKPDVIYFLTDGAFLLPVQKDLRTLTQGRSAIHTFAFGDRSSEELLKALAKRNRGHYTYIP